MREFDYLRIHLSICQSLALLQSLSVITGKSRVSPFNPLLNTMEALASQATQCLKTTSKSLIYMCNFQPVFVKDFPVTLLKYLLKRYFVKWEVLKVIF